MATILVIVMEVECHRTPHLGELSDTQLVFHHHFAPIFMLPCRTVFSPRTSKNSRQHRKSFQHFQQLFITVFTSNGGLATRASVA